MLANCAFLVVLYQSILDLFTTQKIWLSIAKHQSVKKNPGKWKHDCQKLLQISDRSSNNKWKKYDAIHCSSS